MDKVVVNSDVQSNNCTQRGHLMDNGVENSGVVRIPIENSHSETINGKEFPTSSSSGSGNSSKDWRAKTKEIFHPWGPYLPMWKKIFLVSCVIAISTDPLFLYVPYINEENKCIQMDQKLKIVALVLRCVTDISYLIHLILHMLKGFERIRDTKALGKTKKIGLIGKAKAIFWIIPWSLILIDIPAILPLPQVIILVFFTKLRGSRYSSLRKFLNFLVLFQYVPRIVRIYLWCKKLGRIPSSIAGVVWVRGAFNFFLYIIASHAVGALWYFFSIERETTCWRKACKNNAGCVAATSFDCNDKTSRNLTIMNEFCPINPPNATVFDFGIYLDGLQSGIHVSTDFPKKFLQCFWWGLRNLSSFGQNLKTSTNALETFFAAFISIIGLLLFLYLIGNLQTYIQLETTRSEKMRKKLKSREPEIDMWMSSIRLPKNRRKAVKQHIIDILKQDEDADVEHHLRFLTFVHKELTNGSLDVHLKAYKEFAASRSKDTKMKERHAELWIERNAIPKDLKPMIMPYIKYRLQENKGVNLESLLSLLPIKHRTTLKEHLCLPTIKKVPLLQTMEVKALEILISYTKPVVYSENSYIIRKGEPLDFMLFITQGVVWSFAANDDNGSNYGFTSFKRLIKGDYYGEELINWTFTLSDSFSSFPISSLNVRSHTKVEALVLTANDLMTFFSNNFWLFSTKRSTHPTKFEFEWAYRTITNAWRRRHRTEKAQKGTLLLIS